MRFRVAASLMLASMLAVSEPTLAADKVKVGFVSTLSGPSSALGIDIRDGFLLAVKLNGGRLGDYPPRSSSPMTSSNRMSGSSSLSG